MKLESDSTSDLAKGPDFRFTSGYREREASLKALYPDAVSGPVTRSQMPRVHPAPQMASTLTRLPGRTVGSSKVNAARHQGSSSHMEPRQTSGRDRDQVPESSKNLKAIGKRKRVEKVSSHLEFELRGTDSDNSLCRRHQRRMLSLDRRRRPEQPSAQGKIAPYPSTRQKWRIHRTKTGAKSERPDGAVNPRKRPRIEPALRRALKMQTNRSSVRWTGVPPGSVASTTLPATKEQPQSTTPTPRSRTSVHCAVITTMLGATKCYAT